MHIPKDKDEDEDSDEGDEEASCGAAGEQEGVGDGKSAADVLIVGEEKAQSPTLALRNVSSACSMPLLERIREGPSGTTLSWQCSRSTTNAISKLVTTFVLCVCVCDEIYIYICPLLPQRARGVCTLWI